MRLDPVTLELMLNEPRDTALAAIAHEFHAHRKIGDLVPVLRGRHIPGKDKQQRLGKQRQDLGAVDAVRLLGRHDHVERAFAQFRHQGMGCAAGDGQGADTPLEPCHEAGQKRHRNRLDDADMEFGDVALAIAAHAEANIVEFPEKLACALTKIVACRRDLLRTN